MTKDKIENELKGLYEHLHLDEDVYNYCSHIEKSLKELRELREYKSKVEKFVLRNKNIFLKIPVCQFVEILEKELGYKDESNSEK